MRKFDASASNTVDDARAFHTSLNSSALVAQLPSPMVVNPVHTLLHLYYLVRRAVLFIMYERRRFLFRQRSTFRNIFLLVIANNVTSLRWILYGAACTGQLKRYDEGACVTKARDDRPLSAQMAYSESLFSSNRPSNSILHE